MHLRRSRYLRHRFPSEIISHAVWLYHRYGMSFRDVEGLLAERGIIVSYETIRQWCGKFGPDYARQLKSRQGRLGDTWFLDEVFVAINGQRQYLWRAVDQDGDLIDILVQPRRDAAARRFALEESGQERASRDRQAGQLRVAHRDIMLLVPHDTRRSRTIAPKSRTNPRDIENVRCEAPRHPITRSDSCTSTVSFRIYFAWVATG